ncbi:MAG: 30S ribosomal protein S20 [Spirochaetales bacterium]|nr:30S ribosomal protein S20 [Spirochaetales bacterium]
MEGDPLANIASALKRHKQNLKLRARNRMAKSAIHTAKRKFSEAVDKKDSAVAAAELLNTIKLIDTAGSKGILHKNTVARKKSRLQKMYNKLSA